MLCKVSTLVSLEPLSQAKRLSRFNLSSQASIFLSMIGIFAGIYACSTSALAEVEEDFNQEVSEYGYNISSLSNDVITKLFIDNYIDDDVAIYLSNLGSSHDHGEFVGRNADDLAGIPAAFSASTNSRGFDDAFIPETVWSLDASTGAHLNHISGGPNSGIYVVFGGSPEIYDFWIRTSFGLWANNHIFGASVLPGTSPKVQVASCGGSSAERSNLDYCNEQQLAANQVSDRPSKPEQNQSDTAQQIASNNLSSGVD